MSDFVSANSESPSFGVPAVWSPDSSRISSDQGGFDKARDIALAQVFALIQTGIIAAHREIVLRDKPNSYSVVDVARFLQTSRNIVKRIAYSYMDDVAQFAIKTLKEHSPVGSSADKHPGLYRDGHMLFIDGHLVQDAKNWQPGQILYISNPEPYSRKIELGTMSMSVPGHVYETCAPIIQDKFSGRITVRMVFMPLRFGSVAAYSHSAAGRAAGVRRGGSQRAIRDWLVNQPTLIIQAT